MYVYNELKPRLAMGTHVNYDEFSVAELYAEVREHWKGPFRLGAPVVQLLAALGSLAAMWEPMQGRGTEERPRQAVEERAWTASRRT